MNIQFIRLDEDVCDAVNRLAREQGRTVSDFVNEAVRAYLHAEESDRPVRDANSAHSE